MARPSSSFTLFFIILQLLWTCSLYANGCYTSIIGFGDSLFDTGNLKQLNPQLGFFYPPYGETFFHKPTGRASNGRLIIDFIGNPSLHLLMETLDLCQSVATYIYLICVVIVFSHLFQKFV